MTTATKRVNKQISIARAIEAPNLYEDFYMEEPEEKMQQRSSYMVSGGRKFYPIQESSPLLPAGYYTTSEDRMGHHLEKKSNDISEFLRFEGSPAEVIIGEFKSFWDKKELYNKMGEVHKRGFMLWGPPGGGKTSISSIIINDFIDRDNGIVIEYDPEHTMQTYEDFRLVEPNRKVMIVIEDIDTWCGHDGIEYSLLQFLDGNIKYSNTIILSTTNFPERLPDRLINRPSRFDRVTYIGMPSEGERKHYIDSKAKTSDDKMKEKMLKDTNNFTFAHIKELILSIEVFDLDYKETLKRLNKMRSKTENSSQYEEELRGNKKSDDEFVL